MGVNPPTQRNHLDDMSLAKFVGENLSLAKIGSDFGSLLILFVVSGLSLILSMELGLSMGV